MCSPASGRDVRGFRTRHSHSGTRAGPRRSTRRRCPRPTTTRRRCSENQIAEPNRRRADRPAASEQRAESHREVLGGAGNTPRRSRLPTRCADRTCAGQLLSVIHCRPTYFSPLDPPSGSRPTCSPATRCHPNPSIGRRNPVTLARTTRNERNPARPRHATPTDRRSTLNRS